MRKKWFFLFFFSEFFFDFWAKIFRNFGQETSRSCQNYLLRVHTDNFWLEETFKSFEQFCFFCRHLWNGSQNSIYVSRVKSPEETVFLTFLFRIFFQFWAKYFQTFGQKTSRSCQNYPLRVQTNNFWLEIFFKSFEPFWIFCRNLWHGSQTSIFVSRVKIPEEINFYSSFQIFFGVWAKLFFRFLAKKLQEFVKTNFCVCRRTVFGLKFLWKVLNRFGFSAETFGMVLKLLSSCPQ